MNMTATVGRPPVEVHFGENTAEAMRAAVTAEAAAAAALAAAGIGEYASTALGLAGTAIGETFWVPNGDGTGKVYRHDSGPVATALRDFIIDPTGSGAAGLTGSTGGTVQDEIDGLNVVASSLLDLSTIISVTAATALGSGDLNKTVIVSGSASFVANLPPVTTTGQALKLYVARTYTGVLTVQSASGSGLNIDGQSALYLMAGESATLVYDGSTWIALDRVRVHIIAEMRNSGSTSLTTGSFNQPQFPVAGTQLMAADLKALWGYSGGYFTAPRSGTYRLTISAWLNHSGTGQYDVGAYSGSATGGTPGGHQFARVEVGSATYRTIQYSGEFTVLGGSKLYPSIRPNTVTSSVLVDSATLASRIVIEELFR